MKHIFYYLLIFIVSGTINTLRAQQVIITDDATYTTPAAGAALDVKSANKGFLPPRIALTGTGDTTTIPALTHGLLIYNTASAGDVTPGYYYWAEGWIRLSGSTEPAQPVQQNTVTKTENTTLLKTDNVVFASGDITLTLPAISLADDGLEIFVKNVGTHTDLITIVPHTGKTIENSSAHNLLRWEGNTFIAKGSNWIIKDKHRHDSHALRVDSMGSFTTIAEAIEFLDEHMEGNMLIRLGSGTHNIDQTITINLPHTLTIEGLSFGTSEIAVAPGVTGFNVQSETYFKQLTFSGTASSIGVNLSGNGTYYEIKDAFFSTFNRAVHITSGADLWLFEVDFEDCVTAGVEIAAGNNDVTFRTSESDYFNCGKGINLVSAGPTSNIAILSSNFYNSTGTQVGINYIPSTGSNNFRFASFIVQTNSFNNVGTFAAGFDFSLASGRDARIFFENNAGIASQKPKCNISVKRNIVLTSTGSVANNWVPISNFSAFTSHTTKFTVGNNIITYQPLNKRDAVLYITGDLSTSSPGTTIALGIVKNGVTSIIYGETSVFAKTSGEPVQFSTIAFVPNVEMGTTFRLYISSSSTNVNVTINNLNWYTDTH